jgi:hypothetical protein
MATASKCALSQISGFGVSITFEGANSKYEEGSWRHCEKAPPLSSGAVMVVSCLCHSRLTGRAGLWQHRALCGDLPHVADEDGLVRPILNV